MSFLPLQIRFVNSLPNQPNPRTIYFVREPGSMLKIVLTGATSEIRAESTSPGSLATALSYKADLIDGKIPSAQLPSYVDDVLEFANLAAFPAVGETGKIYIDSATDLEYRWSGTDYRKLSKSPGTTDALLEGTTNKYFTSTRVLNTVLAGLSLVTGTAITSADNVLQALGKLQAQLTTLATSVTALANKTTNIDNTSDANKPVSTAQAAAISVVKPNDQPNNYSVVLSDAGGNIRHPGTDATARTYTFQAFATVNFADGTPITVTNMAGGGDLTLVFGNTARKLPDGATGNRTLKAPGMAVVSRQGNEWVVSGLNLT